MWFRRIANIVQTQSVHRNKPKEGGEICAKRKKMFPLGASRRGGGAKFEL